MLKLIGLAGFEKAINDYAEKVEQSPIQIAKKIMLEIQQKTILGSPVITGLYVGSWQISTGDRPSTLSVTVSGKTASESGTKNEQLNKNTTKIKSFNGGTLWLTNNAEYALFLEYGTENMKQQLILTKAIQSVQSRVEAMAKQAVNES